MRFRTAQWARFALLLASLAACGERTPPPREAVVLARVGEAQISDVDFERALEKLGSGDRARTLEQWREQLQLLIDKELLLREARQQGLDRDPEVVRQVENWERGALIEALMQAEMGDTLSWSEADLQAFFAEAGAGEEIRLSRLVLEDRRRAAEALERLRKGEPLAQVAAAYAPPDSPYRQGDLGWVNILNLGNPRLAPLFLRRAGEVELIEAEGLYFLIVISERRQVGLEERRPLAEEALNRTLRQRADLGLLKHLSERYAVQLDTAALGALLTDSADGGRRLMLSRLGEWSVGQYRQALERLGEDAPAADALQALGLQVIRAYIADQILEPEARARGLYEEIERRAENVRQQKMIEALWAREVLAGVPFGEAELASFYQANRERYGALSGAELRQHLVRDVREARAAPHFAQYAETLRRRHADAISVDEEGFRAFVAQQRRTAGPVPQ